MSNFWPKKWSRSLKKFEWWSLTRELLKRYLTEKQNGCLRSGRLREVVALASNTLGDFIRQSPRSAKVASCARSRDFLRLLLRIASKANPSGWAIFKIGNGESGNGEWGTGNGERERGIFKMGNL